MKKLVLLLVLVVCFGLTSAVSAQGQLGSPLRSELKKSSVFPNPFKEKLTIISSDKAEVYIYDSFGKLAHRGTLKDGLLSVNTSDDKPGLYMVVIIIPKDAGPPDKETIKITKE